MRRQSARGGCPMSTETAGFVCLYFGSGEDCRYCGEWLKAAGGPFDGDPRFCSEDCFADAKERDAREARRLACCPECGYQRVRASAPSFRAGVKARALSRPVLLLDVLPQDRDRGRSEEHTSELQSRQ